MKAHAWYPLNNRRLSAFHVCGKCGLITLKNKATEKAMRKPCPGREEDE